MELLDKTKWRKVLANAVKQAYSDIFVMKRDPDEKDVDMIAGKYKSTFNLSDTVAGRAARTFLALLRLCDKDEILGVQDKPDSAPLAQPDQKEEPPGDKPKEVLPNEDMRKALPIGLSYNIQIHLPATKDVEVYNAIFKSMREHIID